jgi:hypothetical protein
MEATVAWVLVFSSALRAELKSAHRRVAPVVGDGADDREARPALRAVDEGIAVAPVGRVEQLVQALVARGDVARDQCATVHRQARQNRELPLAPQRLRLAAHPLDLRERRRLRLEGKGERVDSLCVTLDLHDDAGPVVQHEACEPVPHGQAVHERAEADPLDGAGDFEAATHGGGHEGASLAPRRPDTSMTIFVGAGET